MSTRRDPIVRSRREEIPSSPMFRAWWIRFLEMADIRPGMRVLDISWGSADVALHLLRLVEPGGKVTCVSFTEEHEQRMRAEARSFGLAVENRIEWRVATSAHLPFADEHFDVISCVAGLRHVQALRLAREVHRVLVPGGRFVVTERVLQGTPLDPLFVRARRLFYRYVRRDPEEAQAVFHTADHLADLLREAGFAQIYLRGLERPRFPGVPVLTLVRAWKGGMR